MVWSKRDIGVRGHGGGSTSFLREVLQSDGKYRVYHMYCIFLYNRLGSKHT